LARKILRYITFVDDFFKLHNFIFTCTGLRLHEPGQEPEDEGEKSLDHGKDGAAQEEAHQAAQAVHYVPRVIHVDLFLRLRVVRI
jgi:hypothetical protein